jgi:hypothetical protein
MQPLKLMQIRIRKPWWRVRRYDMNGISQMQGGKNRILLKELNANRSFETLIGWNWKSGKTTYVRLWDRMEGAWLWTYLSLSVSM